MVWLPSVYVIRSDHAQLNARIRGWLAWDYNAVLLE